MSSTADPLAGSPDRKRSRRYRAGGSSLAGCHRHEMVRRRDSGCQPLSQSHLLSVLTGRHKANLSGGEGGIRTLDTLARMPDFESGTFTHSATSPKPAILPLLGRI